MDCGFERKIVSIVLLAIYTTQHLKHKLTSIRVSVCCTQPMYPLTREWVVLESKGRISFLVLTKGAYCGFTFFRISYDAMADKDVYKSDARFNPKFQALNISHAVVSFSSPYSSNLTPRSARLTSIAVRLLPMAAETVQQCRSMNL